MVEDWQVFGLVNLTEAQSRAIKMMELKQVIIF